MGYGRCIGKHLFKMSYYIILGTSIFQIYYGRLFFEVYMYQVNRLSDVPSRFYSESINPWSYFPIGVLQFKLFILAVWVLDWIRVRVQFNLNQRRKLESRGGNVFDMTIKKQSFGMEAVQWQHRFIDNV